MSLTADECRLIEAIINSDCVDKSRVSRAVINHGREGMDTTTNNDVEMKVQSSSRRLQRVVEFWLYVIYFDLTIWAFVFHSWKLGAIFVTGFIAGVVDWIITRLGE